jgi:hypothetical protein
MDFTNAKPGLGNVLPSGATQAVFRQVEPLIGAKDLRTRFLFGINLISPQIDPTTKKGYLMTDPLLEDFIQRAVTQIETESNIAIFPQEVNEKKPWDKQLYDSLGFLKLDRRPPSHIKQLSIRPANGIDVFIFPSEWIETAYLHKGEITIVPLNIAAVTGGQVIATGQGGASLFINHIAARGWIPAYWFIDYVVGFQDGNVPKIINEVVGITAAMEVLSSLAAAWAEYTSTSVGIDGVSQSKSTPGPQKYTQRMQELTAKRTALLKRLKTIYGNTMFVTNV